MIRLITSIIVLFFAGPAAAQCTIIESYNEIHVFPEDPEVGETVTVTVSGIFVDSCWSVSGLECGDLIDQEIAINATYYWNGNDDPPRVCDFLIYPFEISCEYVFDAPGNYLIRLHEIWEPDSNCADTDLFLEVSSSVPTEGTRWGALKAMYR